MIGYSQLMGPIGPEGNIWVIRHVIRKEDSERLPSWWDENIGRKWLISRQTHLRKYFQKYVFIVKEKFLMWLSVSFGKE